MIELGFAIAEVGGDIVVLGDVGSLHPVYRLKSVEFRSIITCVFKLLPVIKENY